MESVFRYAHVYPKCVALLESGQINLKPIITNRFKYARTRKRKKKKKIAV